MEEAEVVAARLEESADESGAVAPSRLSLLARIINNVQVDFRAIHFRYEDTLNSNMAFALGATLEELCIFSANSNGERHFNADSTGQFKVAKVRGLAVYHRCNCEEMLHTEESLAATAQRLRDLMQRSPERRVDGQSRPDAEEAVVSQAALSTHFVMAPVSASITIALRPSGSQVRLAVFSNSPTRVGVPIAVRILCKIFTPNRSRHFGPSSTPNHHAILVSVSKASGPMAWQHSVVEARQGVHPPSARALRGCHSSCLSNTCLRIG
eukprot:scaffold288766_cov33-Tisochrysis_lutea.AAC.6